MNSFSRLNNPFINEINRNSVIPKQKSPIFNTLATRDEVVTKKLSSGIYGVTHEAKLGKNFDNLAQIQLKITVTLSAVTGLPITIEPEFAARIFKEIYLETITGKELQKIIPEYSMKRLDELNGTELYSKIQEGIAPDSSFGVVSVAAYTQTFYFPLFLFFSEDTINFLNTRKLEELRIRLVSNDSAAAMGLTLGTFTITSMETILLVDYHDTNETSLKDELIYTPKAGIKPIVNSFNIFEEDVIRLATGQTSARLLLRCPNPLYVTHFALVSTTGSRLKINSVNTMVLSQNLGTIDDKSNYKLYARGKGYVEAGAYSSWKSVLQDRVQMSGLITYSGSDNMSPTNVILNFDAIPASGTYNIITFSEYLTFFNVDDKGIITEEQAGSKLRYPQSYLPFNAGP